MSSAWPRRTCRCAGPSSTASARRPGPQPRSSTSDEAADASREAQAAEEAQRALLSSVEGDLSGLVAEEAARREAGQAAQRRPATVVPPALLDTTPLAAEAAPAARVLPSSGLGALAVEEAMKHLGKPYLYGGLGPGSFDCSGLTMYAWAARV